MRLASDKNKYFSGRVYSKSFRLPRKKKSFGFFLENFKHDPNNYQYDHKIMSTPILKMARGRQALTNVLTKSNSNSNIEISTGSQNNKPREKMSMNSNSNTWEQHSSALRMWMRSNPLKLGIPNDGCFETIIAQLDRGDKFESARDKCWDHVLMELRHCGGSVDGLGFDFSGLLAFDESKDKIMADIENITPERKCTGTPTGRGGGSAAVMALKNSRMTEEDNKGEGEKSNLVMKLNMEDELKLDLNIIAGDKNDNNNNDNDSSNMCGSMSAREKETPCNFNDVELIKSNESNRAQTANAPAAKKPQTMMERQELWMKKKEEKNQEKQRLKEEALLASVVSKPDVGNSKKSFEAIRAKREAQQKETMKQQAEKDKAAANWNKVKKSVVKGGGGGKGNKNSNKTKPKAVEKSREQQKADDEKKAAQKKVKEERELKEKEEAEKETENKIVFSPTTAMARRRNSCSDATGRAAAEVEAPESFEKSESVPNLLENKVLEEAERAAEETSFTEGSFFTRIDNDSKKGHKKMRDGGLFQMTSMFRKRDKFSGQGSAVSLLVGRTEEAPHDEKVIDVIFDMSKLNEHAASKWFEEHEGRFSSPIKGAK